MIREQAKIFLADERGVSETNCFKRYSTFNFDNYFNQYKTSFGFVEAINDDILDANCSIKLTVEKDYYLLLIPVMGVIKFTTAGGHGSFVAAGQSQLLLVGKGDELMISNPFSDGLINFLHIWIGRDQSNIANDYQLLGFDVNEHKNNLQELSIEWPFGLPVPFSLSIGKFDGRNEAKYRLKKDADSLFVFVIEGAFEVQGRLLHARDGLGLMNISEIEMEALSNNAIILMIESQASLMENECMQR